MQMPRQFVADTQAKPFTTHCVHLRFALIKTYGLLVGVGSEITALTFLKCYTNKIELNSLRVLVIVFVLPYFL